MWRLLRGARVRGCLGGFGGSFCARAPRSFSPVRSIKAHSQQETWSSTPHGSAYCKGPNGRRVGSPAGRQPSYPGSLFSYFCACSRAGVSCPVVSSPLFISLVYLLAGRPLGLRLSLHSGSSQQGPAPWLVLAPSATPRYSPISEAKRVYIVDSFIVAHNAPSTSLVPLFIWSHLQWQTNLSLS